MTSEVPAAAVLIHIPAINGHQTMYRLCAVNRKIRATCSLVTFAIVDAAHVERLSPIVYAVVGRVCFTGPQNETIRTFAVTKTPKLAPGFHHELF